VEAKVQARNFDLAMVAKASSLASERPYRDSGSGRVLKSDEDVFVAMTYHAPKGYGGERQAVYPEHPAAKRTSACRRVAES
jgi:hypothetical protein